MERRMRLPLMLTLSLMLSLLNLPLMVHAQQQPRRRPVAGTGVLTPGPDQLIRVTVNGFDQLPPTTPETTYFSLDGSAPIFFQEMLILIIRLLPASRFVINVANGEIVAFESADIDNL
jgi:hypothetical protein